MCRTATGYHVFPFISLDKGAGGSVLVHTPVLFIQFALRNVLVFIGQRLNSGKLAQLVET